MQVAVLYSRVSVRRYFLGLLEHKTGSYAFMYGRTFDKPFAK